MRIGGANRVGNDERAAAATAATAVGGRTGVGVDTQALGRPIPFNGEDAQWRDWERGLPKLRGVGSIHR